MSRLSALVGLVFALALCPAPASAADPFVLYVLRMLRDQSISSSLEAGLGAPRRPNVPSVQAFAPSPLPATESQQLKQTIDESFVHLGPQQREELHASLMRILSDPKNAPARPAILAEFSQQATAMREAHRYLSRLSDADMRAVAADARVEFARLPPDQRRQLLEALQNGVPGMPKALHDLMIAEFRSVPATP